MQGAVAFLNAREFREVTQRQPTQQERYREYIAAAIERFLARGGKIQVIEMGRSSLPWMEARQLRVYEKLRRNGIDREEALRVAMNRC